MDPSKAADLPSPVFVCDKPSFLQSIHEEFGTDMELVAVEHKRAVTVTDDAGGLCDPNVNQVSGYFRLGKSKKNYFFWFFESRSKPDTDPLVLWLTGGPGCSSEIALFAENGPCTVDSNGKSTTLNKYSWNSNANLLYVDQPSGTGFSYGDENADRNEKAVAEDMYHFIGAFLIRFDKFKSTPFFLFGESYAGHYVPAAAHRIFIGNKQAEAGFIINLKGVSVGNGMTAPLLQYPMFPEMAYHSNTTRRVVSERQYLEMKSAVPTCVALISICNTVGGTACVAALRYCNDALIGPVQFNGWNQYDLRVKCAVPPLCYDFANVGSFLNRPEVRAKLGVPSNVKRWEDCDGRVNHNFQYDWMQRFDNSMIPDLLEAGIPVLIYAGDQDYICNWLGNKKWVLALKWKGANKFLAAQDLPWNNQAGVARNYGPFTFLQVKNAGHMVPMDQPQVSLDMLNQFTQGRSFVEGVNELGTREEQPAELKEHAPIPAMRWYLKK